MQGRVRGRKGMMCRGVGGRREITWRGCCRVSRALFSTGWSDCPQWLPRCPPAPGDHRPTKESPGAAGGAEEEPFSLPVQILVWPMHCLRATGVTDREGSQAQLQGNQAMDVPKARRQLGRGPCGAGRQCPDLMREGAHLAQNRIPGKPCSWTPLGAGLCAAQDSRTSELPGQETGQRRPCV